MTDGEPNGLEPTAARASTRPRTPHRVFDRAPQPHDWRWAVGGVGKSLIVIGLLMFAFVAYQLWGTGIYTARAQSDLDNDFDKVTTTAPAPTSSSATSTTAATPTVTSPTVTSPTVSGPVATSLPETTTGTTTTVTTTPGESTTTSSTFAPYPYAPANDGDVLVRIQIPSIDLDWKVVEGVGVSDLEKGPGHFPESVLPGQLGNAAIAGHRTTYGHPFYDVDKVDVGDQIIISYPGDGPKFVYLVTGTEIVGAGDYDKVVPTANPYLATLALSSCHPIRSAAKRIIIHSELAIDQSAPIFASTPLAEPAPDAALPDEGETSPSDSEAPTTDVPSTSAPEAAVPATTVGPATGAPSSEPVTTETAPTAPSTIADGSTAINDDAFSQGWFHDGAAWPHIIMWGLLLSGIVVGSYLLAKRTRRIWLGTLVGFAPFLYVLYFFFENINRLLPPGL